MQEKQFLFAVPLLCFGALATTSAFKSGEDAEGSGASTATERKTSSDDRGNFMRQSPGIRAERDETDWGLGSGHISQLRRHDDPARAGDRTPFDLLRRARARSTRS